MVVVTKGARAAPTVVLTATTTTICLLAGFSGLLREPQAADATFLRRVTLDLTGVVPTADSTRDWLRRPLRRRLVEGLTRSPDFDRWWARFLLELTIERRAVRQDEFHGRPLFDWLIAAMRQRRGYDAIVRDLIVTRGNAEDAPPVNFLLRYRARPADVTGAIGRAFLGSSMRCAQCHDHPYTELTQDEFRGMSAFLSATHRFLVEDADLIGVTDTARRFRRRATDPQEGARRTPPYPPRWPGRAQQVAKPSRAALADLVIADERFARNLVNRVWARLTGRGLLTPLDGLDGEGTVHDEARLARLTAAFVKSGYDLRALVRRIVLSPAYGKARAEPRALTEDQLFASIIRATRLGWSEDEASEEEREGIDMMPVELFGSAPRSLARSLALLNHEGVHGAVGEGADFVMRTFGRRIGKRHVDYAFLALLTRPPTKAERELVGRLRGRAELEDLLWALINTVEFQTVQ